MNVMKAFIYFLCLTPFISLFTMNEVEEPMIEIPMKVTTRIGTPFGALPIETRTTITIPPIVTDETLQECAQTIQTSAGNLSNTIDTSLNNVSHQLAVFPLNLRNSLTTIIAFSFLEIIGAYTGYQGINLFLKGIDTHSSAKESVDKKIGKKQIKAGTVIIGASLFFMLICVPELIELCIAH